MIINYVIQWDRVKGQHTRSTSCPRCGNKVESYLVLNCSNLLGLKFDKTYGFKCPICPHVEKISTMLAESIIRSS